MGLLRLRLAGPKQAGAKGRSPAHGDGLRGARGLTEKGLGFLLGLELFGLASVLLCRCWAVAAEEGWRRLLGLTEVGRKQREEKGMRIFF